MEILLGIDIGDSRTGLAKADPEGILVAPIKTVKTADLLNELKVIEDEYSFAKFIIGLPKNMDGTEGERVEITKKHATAIQAAYPKIELVLEDERLTSQAAKERLQSEGIKIRQDNKDLVDAYAAVIILEQYLDK